MEKTKLQVFKEVNDFISDENRSSDPIQLLEFVRDNKSMIRSYLKSTKLIHDIIESALKFYEKAD